MDSQNDEEDPVKVIEKARTQDPKIRHDRTRQTLNDEAKKNSENEAIRLSFSKAQIIEVDDEQIVSPASKLDAMFTFLKINFLSMWGTEAQTEKQEEAKINLIKMQLETIDEDGTTKIDINDLRAEIKRLEELHKADQVDDDFNPAMLSDNKKSGKTPKKKKSKSQTQQEFADDASAEPRLLTPDDEVMQSADFGGTPKN